MNTEWPSRSLLRHASSRSNHCILHEPRESHPRPLYVGEIQYLAQYPGSAVSHLHLHHVQLPDPQASRPREHELHQCSYWGHWANQHCDLDYDWEEKLHWASDSGTWPSEGVSLPSVRNSLNGKHNTLSLSSPKSSFPRCCADGLYSNTQTRAIFSTPCKVATLFTLLHVDTGEPDSEMSLRPI